ncbi:TPR repeat/Tetratricopeptide repeat [Chthonomonas calidirosea]|uniref:TPR repeat./Tetratricopeptide repeat n=1 Tax=Chthonomonas calidirosea (strain DSM 23976 / ICMP 18418 / T49) TaxID=1303518 RepID=S0EU07_CHTCT|nr:tetratricopeptide repeat protein [Chthonomonas calidirosea]CCW34737.1 TPR repeat./Tetratricopeptide repeat [Chthonomonas calidirosea T49]CEK13938.1 TPR repeat/Tetratricopeptide repeat [Chthonomonas calidirosea]
MKRQYVLIGTIGCVLIVVSLLIRNSRWAEERMLKPLSAEELAYAVHDRPNDPLVFLYYGSALLKSGDLTDAAYAFTRATKLDPKLYEAYIGLGSTQFRLKDYAAAQTSFQRAAQLRPHQIAPYLGLAQAYYLSGLPEHATAPLKKIVALQPKNDLAWYTLGQMYGDAHEPDQALLAMQRAVALKPHNPEYRIALAEVLLHYARYTDAEQQLVQAIRDDYNNAYAHYLLGYVFEQEGDNPQLRGQAEQEFLNALAREPEMEPAYFDLGQLYERDGDYKPAITNYRKAFHLNPSDAQALYHLGLCLVQSGQTKEGQRLIEGAQELSRAQREIDYMQKRIIADPSNPDLRLRMARIYKKYGNYSEALQQYQVYSALRPPDRRIEKEIAACYMSFKTASTPKTSSGHPSQP